MAGLAGIGDRMAAARAKKQASQIKAAAMLEIADKSYKNYEAEKRELPLAVAVDFCEAFEVQLEWLIYGHQADRADRAAGLVAETVEAVFAEAQQRGLTLSPARAGRVAGYIYGNCTQKGTSPKIEAGPIFDMFDNE